ncbi:hypothetical protein RchiOBHm_Chr5g0050391 [Rosa chinensis]|uniref:Uncharacterized protein n=1 Tax=Rosa chinensis TaxID=74649 RepID=A0A2P6QF64_ROSCH|nr:hypothetical protein RchiOBHm_Chr5g0050391 [Rosa chinensis]
MLHESSFIFQGIIRKCHITPTNRKLPCKPYYVFQPIIKLQNNSLIFSCRISMNIF